MNKIKMRMLQWMCGVTKKDKMRNELVRKSVKVTSLKVITEKYSGTNM